jgi:hypothetical protein
MSETARVQPRLWRIYRRIDPAALTQPGSPEVDPLGLGSRDGRTQLAWETYTRGGLEHALRAYGTMERLAQRGLGPLEIRLDLRDPFVPRVLVETREARRLVIDLSMRQITGQTIGLEPPAAQAPLLFLESLLLQHPERSFDWHRPPLPGQERPGLSLSSEILQLLLLLAKRVGAEGLALRAGNFHAAWAYARHFRFLDGAAQGRFEALRETPRLRPLWLLAWALELGCVLGDGEKVTWSPDVMVAALDGRVAQGVDTRMRRAALHGVRSVRYAFDLPALRQAFPWQRMPPPPIPQRIEELLRPTRHPA